MILMRCTSCNRQLKLADNLQGKLIRCPACKHVFRVTAPVAEVAVVEKEALPSPPPPRQAVKPRAPTPPPKDEDFAEEEIAPGPPRSRRPPVAEEDHEAGVGEAVSHKQARKIARGGANWLQFAFLFDLIAVVAAGVVLFAFGGGRGGEREQVGKTVVLVLMAIYVLQASFLIAGSIMLSGLRGRGLVITACIFSFLLVPQLLVYGGFWGLGVVGLLGYRPPPMDLVLLTLFVALASLLALLVNIFAGIKGLLTLGKPEVKAAMLGQSRSF